MMDKEGIQRLRGDIESHFNALGSEAFDLRAVNDVAADHIDKARSELWFALCAIDRGVKADDRLADHG